MEPREKKQDVDIWREELLAAGWTKVSMTVWKDPNGEYHRGPYGAWKTMKPQAPSPAESRKGCNCRVEGMSCKKCEPSTPSDLNGTKEGDGYLKFRESLTDDFLDSWNSGVFLTPYEDHHGDDKIAQDQNKVLSWIIYALDRIFKEAEERGRHDLIGSVRLMREEIAYQKAEATTAALKRSLEAVEKVKRTKWEEPAVEGQEYPLQVFNFALEQAIAALIPPQEETKE